MPPVLRRPVGALVVDAFRAGVPIEAIETIVANRERTGRVPEASPALQAALELTPVEARMLKLLAQGGGLRAVASGAQGMEAPIRFVGAMLALGHWD